MASHRDLIAWQRAQSLAASVHSATRGAVRAREPSLVDQLRRATFSIAANIAEGHGYGTPGQFRRFLCIALGSAAEADSHLEALGTIEAMDPVAVLRLRDELAVVRRMVMKLRMKC